MNRHISLGELPSQIGSKRVNTTKSTDPYTDDMSIYSYKKAKIIEKSKVLPALAKESKILRNVASDLGRYDHKMSSAFDRKF
jgi:hypothetical protein